MAEHTRNSRSSPEGGLGDISSEKSSVYFDVLFLSGNCNPNRKTANNKSKWQNPLNMKWLFSLIVQITFSISGDPLRWICFECSQPETPEYCTRCSSTSIPTKIQYSYFEVDPNLKRKVCKCTNCPMSDKGVTLHRLTISFSDSAWAFLQTAAIFKFYQFQQMWRRHEWYMKSLTKYFWLNSFHGYLPL